MKKKYIKPEMMQIIVANESALLTASIEYSIYDIYEEPITGEIG